jgi:hypothetical protein
VGVQLCCFMLALSTLTLLCGVTGLQLQLLTEQEPKTT